MPGINRNAVMVFETRKELEAFEKRISGGVSSDVTKGMLDEKTKHIHITRGTEKNQTQTRHFAYKNHTFIRHRTW